MEAEDRKCKILPFLGGFARQRLHGTSLPFTRLLRICHTGRQTQTGGLSNSHQNSHFRGRCNWVSWDQLHFSRPLMHKRHQMKGCHWNRCHYLWLKRVRKATVALFWLGFFNIELLTWKEVFVYLYWLPLRNQGLAHQPGEKSAPCLECWLVQLFLHLPPSFQINHEIDYFAKHSENL